MKRIKNRGDWYVAGVVERCAEAGSRGRRAARGLTWINQILVNAPSPEAAYQSAVRMGRRGNIRYKTAAGTTVAWRFLGLANLTPLSEDIEHGAEILWHDMGRMTLPRAASMVISRLKLLGAIRDLNSRRRSAGCHPARGGRAKRPKPDT